MAREKPTAGSMKRVAQWGKEPAVGILMGRLARVEDMQVPQEIGGAYQSGQLANALHNAPEHRANHEVGKQQSRGTGLRVRTSGSNEEACPDATAESNHGDLIVPQPPLGAGMATHVDLRLLDGGLLALELIEWCFLDILVDVLVLHRG